MRGERPPRPTHPALTDELWALMRRCWDQQLSPRPEMAEVLRILHTPLAPLSFRDQTCIDLIGSSCVGNAPPLNHPCRSLAPI
jgi:hypothetical protein